MAISAKNQSKKQPVGTLLIKFFTKLEDLLAKMIKIEEVYSLNKPTKFSSFATQIFKLQ